MKYIDNEEKELEKSLDSLDITQIDRPTDIQQKKIMKTAQNFIKKEAKMNIRIDSFELDIIKEMAEKEGLKYQTFVKSILHKYITGQLVEKKHIYTK